jgi:membrane fusion protein, multidrug efflux system
MRADQDSDRITVSWRQAKSRCRPHLLLLFSVFAILLSAPQSVHSVGLAEPDMPVRGIVRAVHQAAITSDLGKPIEKLNVATATAFKIGDTLVKFDCEQLEARAEAAKAAYRERKILQDSNQHLYSRGAAGRHDVDVAKARADQAKAEWRALQADLKHCRIIAPFDGRVAELTAHEHEKPAPGQPFLKLVGTMAFEIDLIVASNMLRRISPGLRLELLVDETGTRHEAEVVRTGAVVDPVSQTVLVIARFLDPQNRVLPGMSGAVTFPTGRVAP